MFFQTEGACFGFSKYLLGAKMRATYFVYFLNLYWKDDIKTKYINKLPLMEKRKL